MTGLTLKIVSGLLLIGTFALNALANKVTEAQIKEAVEEEVSKRLETQETEEEEDE